MAEPQLPAPANVGRNSLTSQTSKIASLAQLCKLYLIAGQALTLQCHSRKVDKQRVP